MIRSPAHGLWSSDSLRFGWLMLTHARKHARRQLIINAVALMFECTDGYLNKHFFLQPWMKYIQRFNGESLFIYRYISCTMTVNLEKQPQIFAGVFMSWPMGLWIIVFPTTIVFFFSFYFFRCGSGWRNKNHILRRKNNSLFFLAKKNKTKHMIKWFLPACNLFLFICSKNLRHGKKKSLEYFWRKWEPLGCCMYIKEPAIRACLQLFFFIIIFGVEENKSMHLKYEFNLYFRQFGWGWIWIPLSKTSIK